MFLDMSVIIGIFGLVAYILFFVGLIVKIKQGREKEKILKQLEAEYSEKGNSSAENKD